MRFYFDTEFIEDGKTIELISIGIVAQNGRTLYRESSEVDLARANDFVVAHVIPQLIGVAVSREQIRDDVLAFVNENSHVDGFSPEFWAYYADYDWVVLCQLFGKMVDLPEGWPKYCMDIMQSMWQLRVNRTYIAQHFPQPRYAHNAIADAWWAHDVGEFLQRKDSEAFWRNHPEQMGR
jgi:hypothetical protein